MKLNDYQTRSRETAIYPAQQSVDGLVYSVLALCGETGELANKLKKTLRSGEVPNVPALRDELGDVLWYVASVAHELGATLEEVANENLEKLRLRNTEKSIAVPIGGYHD